MSKVPPSRAPMNGVSSNDWISTYCARAGAAPARIAASVRQTTVALEETRWKCSSGMRMAVRYTPRHSESRGERHRRCARRHVLSWYLHIVRLWLTGAQTPPILLPGEVPHESPNRRSDDPARPVLDTSRAGANAR